VSIGRVALAVAAIGLVAAAPKPRPRACHITTIVKLEPRLEGAPDSGSSVAYADGLRQTSYDVVPALQRSMPGDMVRLCVVERPKGCPPGDTRGSRYAATNLRTSERWSLYDSEHRCGGA